MKLQNRRSFNWDDLRLFLEASRHTTVASAAARLGVDPTTLARRLKRFEVEAGTDLFERGPKGLRLTPTGLQLAAQAEQMEDSSLQAFEMVKKIEGEVGGTVRISTSEGFGSYIVAPALGTLTREQPSLEIELVASSGFLSVTKREADIAILLARPTTGRLSVQKLTDYTLMLYASESYLESTPPIHSVADTLDHRFIGYVDDLIYSPKLRYLDELPMDTTPSIRSSSIAGQHMATRSGAGLCILPCFMADGDPGLVRVLSKQIRIERTFWLAVHEDMRRFARVRATVNFLQNTVRQNKRMLMGGT